MQSPKRYLGSIALFPCFRPELEEQDLSRYTHNGQAFGTFFGMALEQAFLVHSSAMPFSNRSHSPRLLFFL